MRCVFWAVLVIFSVFLAGCQHKTDVLPDAKFSILAAPYQLDSGDVLRLNVFEQANLTNTYTVDQAGYITVPLIGQVRARGSTTQALSRTVATKLKAGFIRNPDVAIEVATYRPFFILGEIANAGQYRFVDGMTAQMAVAIAGGYTPRAEKRHLIISRQINGEIQHGKISLNTPIRPGDTLKIQERWF